MQEKYRVIPHMASLQDHRTSQDTIEMTGEIGGTRDKGVESATNTGKWNRDRSKEASKKERCKI
jgi:hypothetical protein